MRRIVIEEPCEHGLIEHGTFDLNDECPGGSRTVFDGIPEELVERAQAEWLAVTGEASYEDMMVVRHLLESVFGEKEK